MPNCSVRFWSPESELIFELGFMVFFFVLCCSVSVSRPSQRRLRSRAASGSSLQRAPRPAPCESRLVRARD